MNRALVTGATGLVGQRLVKQLKSLGRVEVNALSRDPVRARSLLGKNVSCFDWENTSSIPALTAFDGVDVVFHLAGDSIASGRWTEAKKNRIRQSRVEGTHSLVDAIGKLNCRPRVLVSASAVGYYGDRGDEELDEKSASGTTFLAEVCQSWEVEARRAEELGVRTVLARIGIVLAPDGGALQKMIKPFRLGLGGRLGDGRQWMPWVHIDDVVGLLVHAATRPEINGAVNVVAPVPIANRDFTRALADALCRPAFLPIPRVGLKVAFGELSDVLLASQRVFPTVAKETNYRFHFQGLDHALASCIASGSRNESLSRTGKQP